MQSYLEILRPYLDGADLSEAEKDQYIRDVYHFAEIMVDRHLGTHPVQQAFHEKKNKSSQKPKSHDKLERNPKIIKSRPEKFGGMTDSNQLEP